MVTVTFNYSSRDITATSSTVTITHYSNPVNKDGILTLFIVRLRIGIGLFDFLGEEGGEKADEFCRDQRSIGDVRSQIVEHGN
jgi:hypothetical protein